MEMPQNCRNATRTFRNALPAADTRGAAAHASLTLIGLLANRGSAGDVLNIV
jgi:hypothetical protein